MDKRIRFFTTPFLPLKFIDIEAMADMHKHEQLETKTSESNEDWSERFGEEKIEFLW